MSFQEHLRHIYTMFITVKATVFLDLQYWSFSSYADPMATDFDIWAESKRISDLLNLDIHTEHVPAHQDDNIAYKDLPRTAQINVDMDHAAETIRISDAPTPRILVFESNKIAIVINNAVVTDKLGP